MSNVRDTDKIARTRIEMKEPGKPGGAYQQDTNIDNPPQPPR